MGIKSTRTITRSEAIDRIMFITELIVDYDYRAIERSSFETDEDVEFFVKYGLVDTIHIDKWTNKMLERTMDEPFYRTSKFYNYRVED